MRRVVLQVSILPIQECSQKHAAQLLHPVSTLRKYLYQLCPGHDLQGDIRDLMLLCFYNPGQVTHCIVYQPDDKHFAELFTYTVVVSPLFGVCSLLTKQCIGKVSLFSILVIVWSDISHRAQQDDITLMTSGS